MCTPYCTGRDALCVEIFGETSLVTSRGILCTVLWVHFVASSPMQRYIVLLCIVSCVSAQAEAEWLLSRNLGSKTPYYTQQTAEYTDAPAGCAPVSAGAVVLVVLNCIVYTCVACRANAGDMCSWCVMRWLGRACVAMRQAHMSLVLRHGARNPGDDHIIGFNVLAEKLGSIESLDERYQWMKGWQFPVQVEDQGLLLPLGMREHYELGKRLSKLFPQAFPAYHPNVYSIRGTYVSEASYCVGCSVTSVRNSPQHCGHRKQGLAKARFRLHTGCLKALVLLDRRAICLCTCTWIPKRKMCN